MYHHPDNRPVNLDLRRFRFPLNAKLSAAHRITGLMLIACLITYIGLLNLIALHPLVNFDTVRDHCILSCLNSVFWISLSFHWLSGLRHLLAEHFTQPNLYERINSQAASIILLLIWGLLSTWIIYQAW